MAKFSHDNIPAGYENSKFDKDAGVKEGSPADLARDKKGVAAFKKSNGGNSKIIKSERY